MKKILVLLVFFISFSISNSDDKCPQNELYVHDQIVSMDIHPHEDSVAFMSTSGAYVYSIPDLELLQVITCYDIPFSAYIIDWSPDGSQIAIYNNTHIGIQIYDTETFKLDKTLYALNDDSGIMGSEVDSLSWSPDGKYIAIGSPLENFSFRVWDVQTEEIIYADKDLLNGEYWYINPQGTQWSEDGRYIAIANSFYGEITIVDFIEQETAHLLGLKDEEDIGYMQWNDNHLATGGYQNLLRIWNTDTWEEYQLPNIASYSLAWSPITPNQLAIAESTLPIARETDGDILIFDVETEEITFSFGDTDNWIQSIQWSPNEQYIITLESEIPESHLIVWDATTGEIIAEVKREVVRP